MIDECRTKDAFDAFVKQIQDRPDYVKPAQFGIFFIRSGTWLIKNINTNFGSAAVFWAACGYPPIDMTAVPATQAIFQDIGRAFSWIVGPGFTATPTGLNHLNVQVVVRLLRELKPEDFSKLRIVFDYN